MAKRDVQVHAAIAEAIKGRIARGEWMIGQRLPSIPQLALEFGAGTGSIREAARSIGEMLVTVIRDKPAMPLNKLLKPKLVARASHGPAPQVHSSKQ